MAKKGSFSKVYDKNGDYVDVEAARFDGTRTFQMQGDVSATQTWNGDSASALTLNTSIGAKKVTTDKINDKAVQTGQIDDGAVGLTQIATNAMNGTVQDNDSKLATHAAVKTYVDSQISGQGTYLGKHTVAEINAMATDNLHNGDRVMVSDSGTINLGPGGVGFDVEAGEDLILYKSGSTVQWDSMDGNFKTKQTAVSDPTASGTGLTFIDSASQDENGEMTLSKKTVQDGTTSQKGVVQLEDSHSSTSTTKAATPNSVKEAYDLANTANTGAVKNVAYDSTNKKITKTINGTTTDVVSAATLKTDMALNNVDNTSDANKPVSTAQQAALDLKLDKTGDGKDVTATFTEASTRANIGTGEKLSVIFGKIKKWFTDLGTAAFKNVPASGNASSTEVVLGSDTRLSAGASAVQDVTVDGTSVVNSSTKVAAVPNASTSAKGAVQLAGSIGATVASENNKAATEKAVRDALDGKTDLRAVRLTNSDDLNSIANTYSAGTLQVYNWLNTSVPANAPDTLPCTMVQYGIANTSTSKNCVQVVYPRSADFYFERICNSGTWSAWKKVFYEATSTYSSTGTQAVNGTAVASALSSYELLSNKVSSWQSTPDNTHYPSEKLVKDGLDSKANASDAVGLADSVYRRVNEAGDGWNKLAETTFTRANTNVIGFFDVYYGQLGTAVGYMSAKFNVRVDGSGSTPMIKNVNYIKVSGLNTYSLCVVVRGLTGNVTVELWGYLPKDNISMSIVFRACTVAQSDWKFAISKSSWTFYNYSGTSTSKPVADAGNNVQVTDASEIVIQKNIASPTNNNLVAMDANGLVKDSGLTKSSVESAISSAGSAIQGVKVNNTTLTPDANKVVTVPLATTSADGVMSAADKTKLDGIAEGAEVNVQSDWNQTNSSADDFIKNKPYYEKSLNATGKIFKVFSSPKLTSGNKECYGIELFYRAGYGGIYGNLLFKDVFILQQTKIGNVQAWQTLKFYVSVGTDTVTVYAKNDDGYCTLSAAPLANLPKANVDFTVFGTEVESLPEGATEITPVWVANSASSSGTAPVKVDAYGALTPVPMDSTPTASSTNLVTSGDIKTALDEKAPIASPALTGTPTAPTASSGTNTTQIATTAFVQSAVDAQKLFYNPGNTTYGYMMLGTVHVPSTKKGAFKIQVVACYNVGGSVAQIDATFSINAGTITTGSYTKGLVRYKLAYKANSGSTADHLIYDIWLIDTTSGDASTRRASYVLLPTNIETWVNGNQSTQTIPDGLTYFTTLNDVSANGAVGSTSIPTYVNTYGEVVACTDDFVHDADIAKMVQVNTAGTAVGSSLQPVYVNSSGVATAIDYKKWSSLRLDTPNALVSDWYKSEGSLSITSGSTVKYIELSSVNAYSMFDLWFSCNHTNNPFMLKVRFNVFQYGSSGIKILERAGYGGKSIENIVIRRNDNYALKIYFKVINSSNAFDWRCSETLSNSNFSVLSEADYNSLTTIETCSASTPLIGGVSTSARNKQRGSYDILDAGDVRSTYIPSGTGSTDPLNGVALATKNDLHAIRLTSSNDLNSIANTFSDGTLQVYNWLDSSKPSNVPENSTATMVQYGIANTSTSKNCVQVVYPRNSGYYFSRLCSAGTWSDWKKCWYEATSTYSSTGTQAVNGTAVASAISGKQDTLSFMTTAEAHSLWTNAKANAS